MLHTHTHTHTHGGWRKKVLESGLIIPQALSTERVGGAGNPMGEEEEEEEEEEGRTLRKLKTVPYYSVLRAGGGRFAGVGLSGQG